MFYWLSHFSPEIRGTPRARQRSAGSANPLSRRHQSAQLMAAGFLTSAQSPEFLSDNADCLLSHLPNALVSFTCVQQPLTIRLSASTEVNYCDMIYNDFSIRELTVNVTNMRAADVDSCLGVKSQVSPRASAATHLSSMWTSLISELCEENSSTAVDSMLIWSTVTVLVCMQRLQIHDSSVKYSAALWFWFT